MNWKRWRESQEREERESQNTKITEERAKIQKNEQILPLHTIKPQFLQEDLSRSLFILFWGSLKFTKLVQALTHRIQKAFPQGEKQITSS